MVKIPTATISSIKLKPLCFISYIIPFYQNKKLIIFSPQKERDGRPQNHKLPKAMALLRPYLFLFKYSNETPTIAPTQKAKVTAVSTFSHSGETSQCPKPAWRRQSPSICL